MKHYLLPEIGNFYKANLHCHTTVSDGKHTPEEIKELYMKKGYSIVAYTDHEALVPHTDLNDENFLALHGFEAHIYERKYVGGVEVATREEKTCHLCYIALEQDNLMHPCYHSRKYSAGNSNLYRTQAQHDPNEPDFERSYNSQCINEMIRRGKKRGFFVTYNHPSWSQESYPEYISYNGMHALELFNGGATKSGYEDYNPRVYDDMLKDGKKIYCVGGDDNHNGSPDDSRYSDSGWAWTMIKADNLEYRTVTKALEEGNFYASEGPEIYALWIENNEIHIKCSPADSINCIYGVRARSNWLSENGVPLTEAVFPFRPNYGYFRITVTDEHGKHACTNAYYPQNYL